MFGEMKKLLEDKSITTLDFCKYHELVMKLNIFTVVVHVYH